MRAHQFQQSVKDDQQTLGMPRPGGWTDDSPCDIFGPRSDGSYDSVPRVYATGINSHYNGHTRSSCGMCFIAAPLMTLYHGRIRKTYGSRNALQPAQFAAPIHRMSERYGTYQEMETISRNRSTSTAAGESARFPCYAAFNGCRSEPVNNSGFNPTVFMLRFRVCSTSGRVHRAPFSL